MENGIYVTFLNAGEPASRQLPPVGPLDQVVLRQRTLLAERRHITQADEMGVAIDRWLEAELELERATGKEPGPPKRDQRRFVARDGLYLRFLAFGDAYERGVVPELGPYATVLVTPHGVEADGTVLATHAPGDTPSWTLGDACGPEFVGLNKTDIALRTSSGAYHHQVARVTRPRLTASAPASFASDAPAAAPPPPVVAPAPPVSTPAPPVNTPAPPVFAPTPPVVATAPTVVAPPPPVITSAPPVATPVASEPHVFVERERSQPQVYSPQAAASAPPPAISDGDRALAEQMERERLAAESLRARISGEERRVAQAAEPAAPPMRYRAEPPRTRVAPAATDEYEDEGGLQWGPALWRMRFLIIGVLILLVGTYSFFAIRNGPNVTGQTTYYGLQQKFSSARWDYQVNGVQRVTSSGIAQPRGEFFVVRLSVTNKGSDTQQLTPEDFVLYDANGADYRPASLASGPYQDSDNPRSSYPWPKDFPTGRTQTLNVIFDVTGLPARGNELTVSDVPNTRVKLD